MVGKPDRSGIINNSSSADIDAEIFSQSVPDNYSERRAWVTATSANAGVLTTTVIGTRLSGSTLSVCSRPDGATY